MKIKPLIFLLALTFLFLFSGSVFGGVFDKKDEITSIWCLDKRIYLVIYMKEKTIKKYSFSFSTSTNASRKLIDTIQIKKVTDFYIYGENKTKTSNWTIDRHKYNIPIDTQKRNVFVTEHLPSKDNGEVKNRNTQCLVGERIF